MLPFCTVAPSKCRLIPGDFCLLLMFIIAPVFRSFYIGKNFSHILRLYSLLFRSLHVCFVHNVLAQIANNTILLIKFQNSLWPEFRLFHTINPKRKCFLHNQCECTSVNNDQIGSQAVFLISQHVSYNSCWAHSVSLNLLFFFCFSVSFPLFSNSLPFFPLYIWILCVCVRLCANWVCGNNLWFWFESIFTTQKLIRIAFNKSHISSLLFHK